MDLLRVRIRNRKDRSDKDENEDPIFYRLLQNGKKTTLGQWAKYCVSLETPRASNRNIKLEELNMLIKWCEDHLTGKWFVDEYFFQVEEYFCDLFPV